MKKKKSYPARVPRVPLSRRRKRNRISKAVRQRYAKEKLFKKNGELLLGDDDVEASLLVGNQSASSDELAVSDSSYDELTVLKPLKTYSVVSRMPTAAFHNTSTVLEGPSCSADLNKTDYRYINEEEYDRSFTVKMTSENCDSKEWVKTIKCEGTDDVAVTKLEPDFGTALENIDASYEIVHNDDSDLKIKHENEIKSAKQDTVPIVKLEAEFEAELEFLDAPFKIDIEESDLLNLKHENEPKSEQCDILASNSTENILSSIQSNFKCDQCEFITIDEQNWKRHLLRHKYNFEMEDYEREQTWLQNLWDEVDFREGEINDEADSNIEDNTEIQEQMSDTEQEFDSDDENNDGSIDSDEEPQSYFIGKNKKTKWNKSPHTKVVRTRRRNIVTEKCGVKGLAKNVNTPSGIFQVFFTDQVLNIIVTNTNKYIESVSSNYARERHAKPTDKVEILALIGLLLFAGVRKNSRLNVRDLFRTDGSSPEIFRLAMSVNRFSFLLKCMRFDDRDTRKERTKFDRLSPIRELFQEVNSSFEKYYSPSLYVTIDEKLEAFRGRCGFKQYIPSKPNKYGIKVFALADAKKFYTMTMEVYVGKQPEGPYYVENKPLDLVDRMCKVITQTGRNVTTDNWFTSIDLANTLLEKHNLTIVGTIRKNKGEIPLEFLQGNRKVGSSIFGFRENCTLVSYTPKKKKNMLLISTMHEDASIDEITNKPDIILSYNSTKGGVDTVDKLCATYDCARGTNRWPMVIFYSLLNVCGINSFIIYSEKNKDFKLIRKHFIEKLAYEMMNAHLKQRATNLYLPRLIRERLREICDLGEEVSVMNTATPGRCTFCSSKKNRKTRYNCKHCGKYFCLEHAKMICEDCFENE